MAEPLIASVVHTDRDGGEVIEVAGHRIQYGGRDGDGFCYAHQTFRCIDALSDEEQAAVNDA
jgi:hypothetical protein